MPIWNTKPGRKDRFGVALNFSNPLFWNYNRTRIFPLKRNIPVMNRQNVYLDKVMIGTRKSCIDPSGIPTVI